jgi:hypothetical protein
MPALHPGLKMLRLGKWWVLILLVLQSGCTRRFFRDRADREVSSVISQKDPSGEMASWSIYPSPDSRFADPSNPDRPIMPPDDPLARELSPNPQKPYHHSGVGYVEGTRWLEFLKNWDEVNRLEAGETIPPPEAATDFADPNKPEKNQENLDLDSYDKSLLTKQRPYRLKLEQALELSLINAREYQDRREDLYTAALPVTLERFNLAAQFFGTENIVRAWSGRDVTNGPLNRWTLDSGTGFEKLFPTGAALLVRLANQLTIDLADGRPRIGLSNFTLQLTQPLLQGGGLAVTMEPLTQAERTLLYAVRSFARFRKVYSVALASGDDIFNSPYSFAGLQTRGVGPTLSPRAQGYLPTLLLSAQQVNEAENVDRLEDFLEQFRGFAEGSDVSRLQVDQVEQSLLGSRNTLIRARLNYQNGIDIFKLQLGLPPGLPIELEDTPLKPMKQQLARYNAVRNEFAEVKKIADSLQEQSQNSFEILGGGLLAIFPQEVSLRAELKKLFEQSPITKGTKFSRSIASRWKEYVDLNNEQLATRLKDFRTQLRDALNRKSVLDKANAVIPPELVKQLNDIPAAIYLVQFEQMLRDYENRVWKKDSPLRSLRDQGTVYREVINLFTLVLTEAREERVAAVRESWPSLPPVCLGGVDLLRDDFDKTIAISSQVALSNRLELMNARGQLVDSWRQIRVRANSLLGVLDVGYNLDSASPNNANIALGLGGSRTRHQLTLNAELPLVRRVERNNYRTALISYQRQRRVLQATEDFIVNDVRTDLRNLRVFAENYTIQKRAVELAYALVENSLDVFQAPPDPRAAGGGQGAGNAAALTQQLLNAQSSLLRAQNDLYNVWTQYLIARMQLYSDLELLPLDARGVWKDDLSYECDAELLSTPRESAGGDPNTPRFAELRNGGTEPRKP